MSDTDAPKLEDSVSALIHEIRNSLGAIRNAAELLQRRYPAEGREQRLVGVILAEIERLTELSKKR